MKDTADTKTAELPGVEPEKRPRGRPRKPDAKTDAQRAKEYRQRKRERRAALRDLSKPPASKILDLSGDLVAALQERDAKK